MKYIIQHEFQPPSDPMDSSNLDFSNHIGLIEEWYHPSTIQDAEETHRIKLLESSLFKDLSKVRQEWVNILNGKMLYGLDGSSIAIRREEFIYIAARAGYYSYPVNKPAQVGLLSFSDAFFIIDRSFVRDTKKLISVDPKDRRIKIYEGDLKKGTLLVTWDATGRHSLTHSYIAVRTRMQGLTEVLGLERLIFTITKNGVSNKTVIIVDGPLYPVATKCDQEVLTRFKKAHQSKILLCGITKRIETRMLVSHLSRIYSSFELERYATDLSFAHRFLKPLSSTAFFQWENLGRLSNIPTEWLPASTYFMTPAKQVYRLDIPFMYYKAGIAEDILKLSMALSIANAGGLPLPVERAHLRWSFTSEEKKILSATLDNLTNQILGVELAKPYDEEV